MHYHVTGGHKVTTTVEDQGMKEGSRKLPQEKNIRVGLVQGTLMFNICAFQNLQKSKKKDCY